MGEVGPTLPKEILDKRQGPPKFTNTTLEGEFVKLVSIDQITDNDVEVLRKRSNGSKVEMEEKSFCHSVEEYDLEETIWKYLFVSPPENQEFEDFKNMQIESFLHIPNATAFAVFDVPTNSPVGIACYMNTEPHFLKLEIGPVWFSPVAQRTAANTETVYLLLSHAIEVLGFRRVEWKCDSLNERSRACAIKLGFTFEGIHENEIIYKNRSADGATYRILDREWEVVKANLKNRLQSIKQKM